MERLQKVIAASGLTSRRKAEELITSGRVKVNGTVVTVLGTQVEKSDVVTVDDKPLPHEELEYYLLNKPRGVITSTSDEKNRKTVIDLIEEEKRIYPVGRLDYDTTGVLLLTNDGELTNLLIHPKNKIEKQYVAKIEGIPTKEELIMLMRGVNIDGHKVRAVKVKLKKMNKKNNVSFIDIIINDGRNHQVKKMFEAIGYNVMKLTREKFAFLTVDSLKPGEYRKLNIKEVKQLYSMSQKKD